MFFRVYFRAFTCSVSICIHNHTPIKEGALNKYDGMREGTTLFNDSAGESTEY